MNETIQLLASRRSAPPPILSAPGPSPDQLQQMLTTAVRVPDHGKLAPWRFIIFEGQARIEAGAIISAVFGEANPEAERKRLDLERERFSAPLVVGVVSRARSHVKIPEWEQIMSAGAVCMNLIVAANAIGFATSWLTEWYAYDRAVLARFGLDLDEKMAGFIHVGQATVEPREDRLRPVLSDLVTRFGG